MTNVLLANGQMIKVIVEPDEFLALMATAAPSPWIEVEIEDVGIVKLNTFVVNYFYSDGDE